MSKRLTTEEFIEKAKAVHGDKYDYSITEYKNTRSKISIICPEHGVFSQIAYNHLNGRGCSMCSKNKLETLESFIQKAHEVHNYKYDYSKINYINNRTKIYIVCPIHGLFTQLPHHHLQGCGCPACNESHGENKIRQWLDTHNLRYEAQKKFEDCKNKSFLPFDFYLPDYNLCIEYQGEQHFGIYNHFGGYKRYKKQLLTDNIKKEWCSQPENPDLLEITYKENIEEKLGNLLKL